MTVETTTRRRLECCCCGESAGVWAQWWNRDTGYGICASCIAYNRRLGADDAGFCPLTLLFTSLIFLQVMGRLMGKNYPRPYDRHGNAPWQTTCRRQK